MFQDLLPSRRLNAPCYSYCLRHTEIGVRPFFSGGDPVPRRPAQLPVGNLISNNKAGPKNRAGLASPQDVDGMLRHLVARFQGLEIGFELQFRGDKVHHLRGKVNSVDGDIVNRSYLAQTPGGLVQLRFRCIQAAQGGRDGVHICAYRPRFESFLANFSTFGRGTVTEICDLFGL
jgi:hypothetical protein